MVHYRLPSTALPLNSKRSYSLSCFTTKYTSLVSCLYLTENLRQVLSSNNCSSYSCADRWWRSGLSGANTRNADRGISDLLRMMVLNFVFSGVPSRGEQLIKQRSFWIEFFLLDCNRRHEANISVFGLRSYTSMFWVEN